MATGLNKHERTDGDAFCASTVSADDIPLPTPEAGVLLEYGGKVPEKELLKQQPVDFVRVLETGETSLKDRIPPMSLVMADNLLALRSLLATYKGKVTLIYLDPPYGTGFEFPSRNLTHAYRDHFSEATYVEFIRRRLVLMRELLASDGSIYFHIGHQMLFHAKLILDEVFGAQNFRNLIVRRKCSSKNYTSKSYPNLNDYILFYTKSSKYKWNRPGICPDPAWISKEYPKVDPKGKFKLVPIHAPGVRNGESGSPWRGMTPPPGKHWQLLPSKLEALDQAGEIHWSKNGNPRRKVYWKDDNKTALTDYWDCFKDAHHQSIPITGYPTEKNLSMLKQIVEAASDPDDLVLDPFCGSGTTLHAAHLCGRKWIGIDDSLSAIQTCMRRFQDGLFPMGDYVNSKPNDQFLPFEDMPRSSGTKHVPIDFALYVDAKVSNTCKAEAIKIWT